MSTQDKIAEVLKSKFNVERTLNGDTNINDIGLDSLDIINFLFSIEEATGVKVPDQAIADEGLETISQFADYVDRNS